MPIFPGEQDECLHTKAINRQDAKSAKRKREKVKKQKQGNDQTWPFAFLFLSWRSWRLGG